VTAGVRVQGLDDFRRELRRMGARVTTRLSAANQDVADRLVVNPARREAQGQPGATGKLAEGSTIRAARRQKASVVVIGGTTKSPWALGAEFGAKQYPQFPPFRGNQFDSSGGDAGYAVHPVIRRNLPDIETAYLDAMEDLAAFAFPRPF
jgi:hypothetical protein